MAWVGVITNAGRDMLNAVSVGGHTLDLVGATVGSGTVAEANLRIQTAVTGEKMAGSIITAETVDGGTKYAIQVGPASADVGAFTAHQIGLWAALDEGDPVLIMLAQDSETGVGVPLASVSPNFAFCLYAALAVDNTNSLTVVIDESAYVSAGVFNAAIGAKLDKSKVYNDLNQTNAGYALDARAAVKLDSRLGNIEEMAAASVGPASSITIDNAGAKDAPFVKLLLHVKIVQSGSGDPSAVNVRPFRPQSSFEFEYTTISDSEGMAETFSTVKALYGGILDIANQKYIRVYGHIVSYNGESLPGMWYSSKDVYAEGRTPTTGAEVVYALETPVVESMSLASIDGTPKTIRTITAGTGLSAVSANYLTEDKLLRQGDVDSTPTSGSSKPVSSDGVFNAIAQSTVGRVFAKTVTATTNTIGLVFGSTEDIIGVANVQILGAYLARGSFDIRRRVTVGMYGSAGYYLLCEDGENAINSQSVTLTVFYTIPISTN